MGKERDKGIRVCLHVSRDQSVPEPGHPPVPDHHSLGCRCIRRHLWLLPFLHVSAGGWGCLWCQHACMCASTRSIGRTVGDGAWVQGDEWVTKGQSECGCMGRGSGAVFGSHGTTGVLVGAGCECACASPGQKQLGGVVSAMGPGTGPEDIWVSDRYHSSSTHHMHHVACLGTDGGVSSTHPPPPVSTSPCKYAVRCCQALQNPQQLHVQKQPLS